MAQKDGGSSWKNKTTKELRQYISKNVDIIRKNSNTNDPLQQDYINELKDIGGVTKKGQLRKYVGLTKPELIYYARQIKRYIDWDRTSGHAIKELSAKTEAQRLKFNKNRPEAAQVNEEQYETIVELIHAFNADGMTYGSEQIIETLRTQEVLGATKSDLVDALVEASKIEGIEASARKDKAIEALVNIVYQRDKTDYLLSHPGAKYEESEEFKDKYDSWKDTLVN